MNIVRKRKLHTCLAILMLFSLLAASGCGKKKEATTKEASTDISETIGEETTGNDEESTQSVETSPNDTGSSLRDGISQLINFTTTNNYHSYFTVEVTLPAGVKASDITDIVLGVDTQMPLELRLYVGGEEVFCDDAKELTKEVTKLNDTVTGTVQVEEDGESVTKQIHSITNEIVSSTRLYVTEGTSQELTFAVDDHAKELLGQIEGNTLKFAVYAHDVAPAFGVYEFNIKTASDTITVDFSDDNIHGVDGGFVSIVK